MSIQDVAGDTPVADLVTHVELSSIQYPFGWNPRVSTWAAPQLCRDGKNKSVAQAHYSLTLPSSTSIIQSSRSNSCARVSLFLFQWSGPESNIDRGELGVKNITWCSEKTPRILWPLLHCSSEFRNVNSLHTQVLSSNDENLQIQEVTLIFSDECHTLF